MNLPLTCLGRLVTGSLMVIEAYGPSKTSKRTLTCSLPNFGPLSSLGVSATSTGSGTMAGSVGHSSRARGFALRGDIRVTRSPCVLLVQLDFPRHALRQLVDLLSHHSVQHSEVVADLVTWIGFDLGMRHDLEGLVLAGPDDPLGSRVDAQHSGRK